MKKATILFDLDGTLIDSTEAIYEGFGVAFEKRQRAVPARERVVELIGYTLEEMFGRLGVERGEVDSYVAAYKAHYRLISKQKTVLLPRAREAIERASEVATLGVVTTKTGRFSRELLEHMGLLHHFKSLVGREDVTHAKPHPEPILKAMRELGASAPLAWMIGDTPLDILAAQEAGVQAVALKSGYAAEDLLRKYTSTIVNDAFEAVCLIENYLKS